MTDENHRLYFIDWARSIAIILMLQGHFISLTLNNYSELTNSIRLHGTSNNIFIDAWVQLRGITAPLFFTITGLVFVYLLSRKTYSNPFQNKRVKKGVKRAFQIIITGYLLQLNIKNIPYYLSGNINNRFFAFHVLQCIGVGILLIILLYIISFYTKKIPFAVYLISFSLIIFGLKPYFNHLNTEYFPENAPAIVQNIFHGENSVFPFSPWMGYILFGGFLGTIMNQYKNKIHSKYFWLLFFTIMASCLYLLRIIFDLLGIALSDEDLSASGYFFIILIKIVFLISILILIDKKFQFKSGIFTSMGQNTLFIYVLHAMILYGAFIGIGLNTYFSGSLSGTESIFGAILFILFFGVLVKIRPKIKEFLISLGKKLKTK